MCEIYADDRDDFLLTIIQFNLWFELSLSIDQLPWKQANIQSHTQTSERVGLNTQNIFLKQSAVQPRYNIHVHLHAL